MQHFIDRLDPIVQPFRNRVNTFITGQNSKTTSNSHGEFDNDLATMNSMLELVVGPGVKSFETGDLEGY